MEKGSRVETDRDTGKVYATDEPGPATEACPVKEMQTIPYVADC